MCKRRFVSLSWPSRGHVKTWAVIVNITVNEHELECTRVLHSRCRLTSPIRELLFNSANRFQMMRKRNKGDREISKCFHVKSGAELFH